jgi:NMD protein affecting ribosome stability and mRNA decay
MFWKDIFSHILYTFGALWMRFCSRCGREESAIPIVRHLCVECYLEVYGGNLVPRSIELFQCPSCGSYRLGDRWIDPMDLGGEERILLAYVVEESISMPEGFESVEVEDLRVYGTEYGEAMEARLRISIAGRIYNLSRRLRLSRMRRLCPVCHMARGGGYQAILQIRGYPSMGEDLRRRVENIIAGMPETIRSMVVEYKSSREGIDLKLASRQAAQSIANIIRKELGGVIKTSEEGERRSGIKGGKKSKLVISLRIADLREGIYIKVEGNPYIVEGISGDQVVLQGRDGRRYTMSIEEILKGRK